MRAGVQRDSVIIRGMENRRGPATVKTGGRGVSESGSGQPHPAIAES